VVSTAFMSVIDAVHAQANGNVIKRPMAIGYMMTLETFIPGLGISSQRYAPTSLPRKEYTALLTLRMKANPSLFHPVELVVSLKIHEAGSRWFRLHTSSAIVVAERVQTASIAENMVSKSTVVES
jgi:hypothetical protein